MTGFHVDEVMIDETTDRMSPIEQESASISIPREVLEGATAGTPVRMASLFFRNMSGLLPESLNDGAQNDTYVSSSYIVGWQVASLVPRPWGDWESDWKQD